GVKKEVSRQMTNIIATHTGSTPILNSTGATRGNTIRVISTQSRKKPSKKVINKTVSNTPVVPKGRPVMAPSITSSPPSPRKTDAKTVAPMKIPKINADVRLV